MAAKQTMVRRYAAALYNVAVQQGDVREVSKRLTYIRDVLKAVPVFGQLLLTHRVSSADKLSILKKVLEKSVSELEIDIISHLLDDGHFMLFNAVVKRFEYLVESDSNMVQIQLTTAHKISEEEVQTFSDRIEAQLSKSVSMHRELDPSLIGGVKLRVGNTLIDSSISGRLQKLRDTLVQV